jgi:hypothetical protein
VTHAAIPPGKIPALHHEKVLLCAGSKREGFGFLSLKFQNRLVCRKVRVS